MTVKVGDYVSFQFRGEEFRGTVSSIYEEKGRTLVCGALSKDSLFGVNLAALTVLPSWMNLQWKVEERSK